MLRVACALPLLLLALALPASADVVAREGKGWLERREDGRLVLHLAGTPREMGFQQGKLVGDLAKIALQNIVDNQTDLGKSDEYTAYLLMRDDMHAALRPHIPARFVEEMQGLSEGSGIPYEQIEAGNLFPAAFHCSGIALRGKATKDGQLWHVRILDYMTKMGLQDLALITIREPEGHKRWLDVGFAGFIGTVTGMNEAQVAIGEMGGRGLGAWDGVPMAFLMRDALERANTLAEALEIFKTSKRECEYYYVISDGKTRDAVGLWCTPKDVEVIKPGETYAMFENMKPRAGAAGGKAFGQNVRVDVRPTRILFRGEKGVTGFIAIQPEDTLVMSGEDRYQHFQDALAPRYGQVDGEALQVMCKRPVSMNSNLHVAIFHPETLEVWVAVAAKNGDPACDQPYAKFSLAQQPADTPKK